MDSPYHISEEEIRREEALIEKAKKDPAQFAPLYDRYFDRIFNFIYRRCEHEETAGDLTSQVFFKALQNLGKYKSRGLPFSAWLYKIAGNEVSGHFRRLKRDVVFSLEEPAATQLLADTREEPDEENKLLLVASLKKLKMEEVLALELKFMEDKTFKEIGFIMEMSESAAKMKVYRALEKLKVYFKLKSG